MKTIWEFIMRYINKTYLGFLAFCALFSFTKKPVSTLSYIPTRTKFRKKSKKYSKSTAKYRIPQFGTFTKCKKII